MGFYFHHIDQHDLPVNIHQGPLGWERTRDGESAREPHLLLGQPLKVNPAGQQRGEQGQEVLLDPADGGGQGLGRRGKSHLLNHTLEGSRPLAGDSTQGLWGQGQEQMVRQPGME